MRTFKNCNENPQRGAPTHKTLGKSNYTWFYIVSLMDAAPGSRKRGDRDESSQLFRDPKANESGKIQPIDYSS